MMRPDDENITQRAVALCLILHIEILARSAGEGPLSD
jgi:hypothetical protein